MKRKNACVPLSETGSKFQLSRVVNAQYLHKNYLSVNIKINHC